MNASLRGRKVLVTRARHQAGELVRALEARGMQAFTFPTIEIGPPASWSACDAALARLERYDTIIFTSANAAVRFFARARELKIPSAVLEGKEFAAVGDKTRLTLEAERVTVRLVPEIFTAAELAQSLGAGGAAGKRILHPKGDLADEKLEAALRENGATVDAVVVYTTGAPGPERIDEIRRCIESGVDVVTFASPSAFRNLAARLAPGEAQAWKAKIAVIGPVTAKAVREAGLTVDIVARSSTSESLAEAIAAYFSTSSNET